MLIQIFTHVLNTLVRSCFSSPYVSIAREFLNTFKSIIYKNIPRINGRKRRWRKRGGLGEEEKNVEGLYILNFEMRIWNLRLLFKHCSNFQTEKHFTPFSFFFISAFLSLSFLSAFYINPLFPSWGFFTYITNRFRGIF